MRLPSLATVAKLLAVFTVILIVAIAIGIGYLIGDYRWSVGIAVVLVVLAVPPIFVAQNLIERYARIRRARNFRRRAHGGQPSSSPGGS